MIEVSWNTALMIYLSITLAPLIILWVLQHNRKRKQKISIEEHRLIRCEYCHFCYLDEKIKGVTRCPQCLSYNQE
jgi:predicted Zn-ribbon and HTH transcriptional regulator